MPRDIGYAGLAAALGALLLVGNGAVALAAGEKAAVYGGDLTPEWRRELAQVFGVDRNTEGLR